MKNKGLTYGLLIIVAIVWYQVFVRVKSNFNSEDVPVASQSMTSLSRRIARPESFVLQADYRDPFSGSLAATTAPPAQPTAFPAQSVVREPKPKPAPVPWPTIRYYGLVRKTTSSAARSLLSIDGTYFQLKQGEEVLDNLRVKAVYRDSVVILYKKEVRTFRKSGK